MSKIRIGGGAWRSRLLRFQDAPGLRPTPDRVRETLFNWLGQELHGKCCLDLFAGSGALGFEAASRGAAQVVMVENNPVAARHLQDNAALLQASQILLVRDDALRFLATNSLLFDVIFLDPPFNQGWLERVLPQMQAHLKPGGTIYVEAETELVVDSSWRIIRHRRAGSVNAHLIQSAQDA